MHSHKIKKAFYASDVNHYDYVVEAMKQNFGHVSLARRHETSPLVLDLLKHLNAPQGVTSILKRRLHEDAETPDSVHGIGPLQYVHPLAVRAKLAVTPSLQRKIVDSYARRVAKAATDVEIFHFVEGLGHQALRRRQYEISICERRNFHHTTFERDIEIFGKFPFEPKKSPFGDIYDYECEKSDFIHVYSECTKTSFVERGFDPRKIFVSPIGLGKQLPRRSVVRDPFLLSYIGRGDAFKGLDVAVEAVRQLGHPYTLEIAGPMPQAVKVWLSQKSFVTYRGILSREELVDVYSRSGGVLMPSIESFGLAVAEAAFHGARVFCTQQTGMAEYLPNSSKFVVPDRDPVSLAQAISEANSQLDNKEEELCRLIEVDKAYDKLSGKGSVQLLGEQYRSILGERS